MTAKHHRRKASTRKSDRPKVNLRDLREQKRLSLQDIQVRVGIPLEHIEALETGIVPDSLKGRKLLRSKHQYLSFLGQPQNARLEVKRKKRRVEYSEPTGTVTGSTEIEIPSTSKSILTGFSLAIGLVLGLKTLSFAMENDSFSLDKVIDDTVQWAIAEETPASDISDMNAVGSLVNVAPTAANSANTNEPLTGLMDNLLTLATENSLEAEPTGPFGPNSLSIKAQDRTKIRLTCDGYNLGSKRLEPSQQMACNYTHEATVHVSDISSVVIKQNERIVRPMGPQGAERSMTFVQD